MRGLAGPACLSADVVERLARLEHRRWEHLQRRNGRQDHRLAVPWAWQGIRDQGNGTSAALTVSS